MRIRAFGSLRMARRTRRYCTVRNVKLTRTPRTRVQSAWSLQRLNDDSSFLLCIGSLRLVIDPWLTGPEIDGFSLFNTAEHTSECVQPKDIGGRIDGILVSLPFSDHCHEITLSMFPAAVPIYACSGAARRIRQDHRLAHHRLIELSASPTQIGCSGVFVRAIPTSGILDFTHSGLVIEDSTRRVVYSPHGLHLSGGTSHFLAGLPIKTCICLMVTCSEYSPPLILGGKVNLGFEAALKVINAIGARSILDIHSEQKSTSGLIPSVSSSSYLTNAELKAKLKDTDITVLSSDTSIVLHLS